MTDARATADPTAAAGSPRTTTPAAAAAASEPDRPTSALRQSLDPASRMVFIGLMLGMLVAAVSQTIVSPAMPIIVAELGGMAHYSWLATSAMLVAAVVVPIVGKLSDMYGRRGFYIAGLIVFMSGSILAGLAQDFWWLVGARGVQGLGMGALMTLSQTIIGDIIPARQRGKYQGYMGAIFGVTSIAGPLIGGWVTDSWGWRWLFYAGIPFGILALWFVTKYLHLPHTQRKAKVDVAGILTLSGALITILLACSWGGTTYPWGSAQILGLFGVGAVLLAAFIPIELRAEEPVIPLRLFRNSIFTFSVIASLAVAMAMFGAIFYIPVYAQGVLGVDATSSGAIVVPMSASMIGVGIIVGLLITKFGYYKRYIVGGTIVMLVGFWLLTQMHYGASEAQLIGAMIVVGVGLGGAMQTFTLIVQNAVERRDLGVATAATQFFRSAGATIGIAVLGTIMTSRMLTAIPEHLPPGMADDAGVGGASSVGSVLDPDVLDSLPPEVVVAVRQGLADALHGVFVAGIPLVIVAIIAAVLVKAIPLRTTLHEDGPSGPAAGGADGGPDGGAAADAGAAQPLPDGTPAAADDPVTTAEKSGIPVT